MKVISLCSFPAFPCPIPARCCHTEPLPGSLCSPAPGPKHHSGPQEGFRLRRKCCAGRGLPQQTLWCLSVGELKDTGSPWEGMNRMKDWHLHLLLSVNCWTLSYKGSLTSEGFVPISGEAMAVCRVLAEAVFGKAQWFQDME